MHSFAELLLQVGQRVLRTVLGANGDLCEETCGNCWGRADVVQREQHQMLLRVVLWHRRPLLTRTHRQRLDMRERLGVRSQARRKPNLLARYIIADAQALCEVESRFAFAGGQGKFARCAFERVEK